LCVYLRLANRPSASLDNALLDKNDASLSSLLGGMVLKK
jgi:hypothetical protein